MPVKSKSRTFKPGEDFEDVFGWCMNEISDATEEVEMPGCSATFEAPHSELKVKKRLVITITYERDDKTE
jgi:hypothetical protein